MKAGNRHGRQDHLLVAVLCTVLALSAAPAQAMTGGVATTSPAPTAITSPNAATAATGISFGEMRAAGATWYGPGLYGNRTACGQVLRPGTVGVAHRSLPCGAAVRFVHDGRALVTRVIDRGPYTVGNAWDLTNGARLALGFEGVGMIRYAVELRYAEADQTAAGSRSTRSRG
jgi:rare lipoprotein A (peptidoglycan hydrolase)